MSTATKRVLPADVYDALEFSALVYGGIGAGDWCEEDGTPLCIVGHATAAAGIPGRPLVGDTIRNAVTSAAHWLAWAESQSDDAVRAINIRRDRRPNARVPFALWCAELGVERGS